MLSGVIPDNSFFLLLMLMTKQQEVHGPHRSPEKTVQINKHTRLYNNINKEKKKTLLT